MKSFITILMLFGAVQYCISQKIEYQKVFGGYKFSQNDKKLRIKDFLALTEQQEEIHKMVRSAKNKQVYSYILAVLGGGLTGWSLGQVIAGNEPQWLLLGSGVGLGAIAISIESRAYKKLTKAADLYNQTLDQAYRSQANPQLQFFGSSQGIGLSLSW